MKPKRLCIYVALLVILSLSIACRSKNASEQQHDFSVRTAAEPAPPLVKQERILTKHPDFVIAWNGGRDTSELVERFSQQYQLTKKSIREKLGTFNDPAIKASAERDMWGKLDKPTKAAWEDEAKRNFLEFQRKFLAENKGKLFEVGRLAPSDPSMDDCWNSGVPFQYSDDEGDKKQIMLCRAATSFLGGRHRVRVKLTLAEVDNIIKKFDSLTQYKVDGCVNDLARQNGYSAPPQGGALDEARRSCIPEVRATLSVVAEGDLLKKRVSKVYFVDYQTENVIAELPASELVLEDAFWRTPSENGLCRKYESVGLKCE